MLSSDLASGLAVRPAFTSLQFGSGSASDCVSAPPSEVPGLPPGFDLLFRSFAVRFVHGSYLEVSFGFVCSAQFVSFRSFVRPVRFRSFSFRFELVSYCSPVRMRVI